MQWILRCVGADGSDDDDGRGVCCESVMFITATEEHLQWVLRRGDVDGGGGDGQ